MFKKFFLVMALWCGFNDTVVAMPVAGLKKAAKVVAFAVAGSYAAHRAVQEHSFYKQRIKAKMAFSGNENKSDKPIVLFSHGNGENEHQVQDYLVNGKTGSKGAFICNDEHGTRDIVSVRYNNAPEDRFNRGIISSKDSHLGQDGDMTVVVGKLGGHGQADIIGVSRGASGLINVLGAYELTNEHVGSAVIESPFATILDVIGHELGLVGKVLAGPIEFCLSQERFKGYSPYGIRPLDVVHKIDPRIPLLFVCSQEDAKIPVSSTLELARKLQGVNHPKIHVLVLDRGKHGALVKGDDAVIYRNVVHAFWRYYGRPHNPEWADAGQLEFEKAMK